MNAYFERAVVFKVLYIKFTCISKETNSVKNYLKGLSHEIKVCFFWVQWVGNKFLIFPRKGFSSYYQRFHV